MLTILIGPYEFRIRAPYASGHVLTADEARAFNDWRARGIVGNMREVVNTAAKHYQAEGELLPDRVLDGIQKQIEAFDAGYAHPMERGTRNTRNTAKRPRGKIEAEAIRLAARWLEAENRRVGRKQHSEDFDAEVESLAKEEHWRNAARGVIRNQARVGRGNVE